jgi:flavorubredoxin
MFTRIDEIIPNIFKLSVSSNKKFVFSQFLIIDEYPMLIHTGHLKSFDAIYKLVDSVCDPSKLRYIAFCHLEADECGSLNQWLEVAQEAVPLVSPLNQFNINDMAIRKAQVLKNQKSVSLGSKNITLIETPHFPHGWEGCLFYESENGILFCSDLAAQPGNFDIPLTDEDLTELVINFQRQSGFMVEGKTLNYGLEAIKQLKINYLATMHGSVIYGETIPKLLHELQVNFGQV